MILIILPWIDAGKPLTPFILPYFYTRELLHLVLGYSNIVLSAFFIFSVQMAEADYDISFIYVDNAHRAGRQPLDYIYILLFIAE